MKKIVSLILAVALIATLAISASAATVGVHEQNGWETQNQIEHGDGFCAFLNTQAGWFYAPGCGFMGEGQTPYLSGVDYVQRNVAACSQMVKITEAPEDLEQTWTTCAQALTIAEGKAICENKDNGINNLTVFRQRNVTTAGGTLSLRLWPCDPANKGNQSVIVLYRADGGEWTVLANQFGTRDVTVTLPAGSGAYAVCLGW